ncbi:MAG: sugar phosphate isomerase/epimerase [Pseudomonadota bacterium]
MQTIKGPAIFLAQFAKDEAPFHDLPSIAAWAADLGYEGIQIPTWESSLIDLSLAAESQTYADEIKGICTDAGVAITELSTHLQGQLVAVHPAYNELFDGFAPDAVHGKPEARTEWACEQVKLAAKASQRLGLDRQASFSGALLWPMMYPWPQRPKGLVDDGFRELAHRWRPLLDANEDAGVDVCFELHPGEDLHDGVTYERFLDAVDEHPRANILYDPSHFVLQQLNYIDFIDIYKERIRMFHVKDAEFRPTGRSGVYGGYQDWVDRPGRFRSLGDGQVDFVQVFSKLSQYGFDGWAVLEWECALKDQEQGAREGSPFIRNQIINVTETAFDDFAGSNPDPGLNARLLGIQETHKKA